MNLAYLNLAIYLVILTALAIPLGKYIAAVFQNKIRYLAVIERPIYKLLGTSESEEQNWKQYAISVMMFNLIGIVVLFVLQLVQKGLPLNPQHLDNLSWDLALNTAISFVGNTNWQAYAGETTMSYFTQMVGLAVQNFVSAATGLAVVIALIRSFSRASTSLIGNFWSDLTKSTLYVLLPLSIIFAVGLMSQGVPQNFTNYATVQVLDPQTISQTVDGKTTTQVITTQTIPMGPIASQEAIKMIGTNGGGFFNANSAHPYENPNAISNWLEMLAILLVPAALCFTFGNLVTDKKQGYTLYITMSIVFIILALTVMWAESQGNPLFTHLRVDQLHSALQSGGNMEGKEIRFGVAASALFSIVTTAASCGAVNAMHDSFTPLGGMFPLFNMQLGEVVVGGVGAGINGFLLFAILAIFVAGLMVGRSPEYVGKKIEAREVKLAILAIAVLPLVILGFTALASVLPAGLAGPLNKGPHGFSEILYAFTSATANNGSAFAGLSAGTPFYNGMLGVAMWLGRFLILIPVLAIAGSLAAKRHVPMSSGSFPTTGGLWVGLLVGIILILGGLTFLPSLALGPIADHIAMIQGQTF